MDRRSDRPLARLSRRGPVEAVRLHVGTPSAGHAISFGSGPDVFRLLQDFPLVPNLHLVDMLFGQSEPANVIRELEARLRAIGGVDLLEEGFVRDYGWDLLESRDRAYKKVSDLYPGLPVGPRIWRLRWMPGDGSTRETVIHLHMLDFDNPDHMEKIVHPYSSHGGIAGALMTGTAFQNLAAAKILLGGLNEGGVFAYEVFYRLNGELQTIGDEDHRYRDFLAFVRAQKNLSIEALEAKPNASGAFGNFSRMHLIRKTGSRN